jgi:ABC-type phosphate transport system substrate-binding protein
LQTFTHLLPVLVPLIAAFVATVASIVSVVGQVAPSWLPIRGHKVAYIVHYDDFVGREPNRQGLGEVLMRTDREPFADASFVMIRISNEGGLNISQLDWSVPIVLGFDGRKIQGVDVSLSEGGDALQRAIKADAVVSDDKRELRLPKIVLTRKQRFRLLVLLSGQPEHRDKKDRWVTGSAQLREAVSAGDGSGFLRETGPGRAARRSLWLGSLSVICIALSLIVVFVIRPQAETVVSANCVPGTVVGSGSTAFAPTFASLAGLYIRTCPSAGISVDSSVQGSIQAASSLQNSQGSPQARLTHVVMTDGALDAGSYPNLVGHQVAILIFAMVVNKADSAPPLTQRLIRDIWAGKYSNWSQLGGADLPIKVVSRSPGSGTARTFEAKVLANAAEPPSAATSCGPGAPVIAGVVRCSEGSTDEELDAINATPGAIGYAEATVTDIDSQGKDPNVMRVPLDDQAATATAVEAGQYPFWAVEYLYTYEKPPTGSLLLAFIDFMFSGEATRQLADEGDIPCVSTRLCLTPAALAATPSP